MTYRIQEIATQKELFVHYDRLKLFHERPPTSNVPTRDKRNPKNISQTKPQQQEPSIPKYDHDQCTWHYPYHTVPSATTCSRGVACTTPPATPAPATTPVGSPKSVLPSPSSSYSGAAAPYSHGSPGTPQTTTSLRSGTPTLEPQTSAESPAHSRSLPSSPSTPSSVRSKPSFREVIDNASRTLQFGEAAVASTVAPQRNLRSSTKEQRKAQPLWQAKLPADLSEFGARWLEEEKEKFAHFITFTSFRTLISHLCPSYYSFRLPFLLSLVFLDGPPLCYTVTHYSTHLNDQPEVPVFKKGAAFLFKHQAVTIESESKVRVFSPFPRIPDVNLTGAEELLSLAKIRITGIGGMYVQKVCEFQEINETYGLLMTQLKDRVELIKLEVKQATDEQGKLADVMKSFLPKQYQRNVATLPRSKRFIGAIAALAAGAGLILGDPLKEAACTAISIFNLCDDTSSLSQDVDQILKTEEETIATLQPVLSANDENFFLLGNEVRKTQQNVKNLRDAVNDHLQVLQDRINGIQGDLIQHKECQPRQAQHSLFLQEIRYVISHLGTLYTHIKSYQAAFYAYKINLFSTISSLASGQITPQFLLPQQTADIVRTLLEEESYRGTKFTPALEPGFEAVYYEIQLVLEVTLIPRGISVVLGVPMNSNSSTFNVYHATPLYQPNGDNKTASLFQLPKPFLAVATDDSRYAELDSSTLQQCSGNNRIRLCRKCFSTTTDDTLLCLSSLTFDYAIPALCNCPANSVLLPDAPQAFVWPKDCIMSSPVNHFFT